VTAVNLVISETLLPSICWSVLARQTIIKVADIKLPKSKRVISAATQIAKLLGLLYNKIAATILITDPVINIDPNIVQNLFQK